MKCPECSAEMKYFFEPSNDESPHKDGYKCPSCNFFKQTPVHIIDAATEETWGKMIEEHLAYFKRHPNR